MMKIFVQLFAVTMALASVSVHAKLGGSAKVESGRRLDGFFTRSPTLYPTTTPPTDNPTLSPTDSPTSSPTLSPTASPTVSPTSSPSSSPSVATPSPTTSPTAPVTPAPTMCKESYLTSENLNLALVVDLSFSTYTKTFSSEIDIGDVNNDGKGNTILDAQNVAIEDLLINIAQSEFLTNENCEIALISFHTSSTLHGVWNPLNEGGTGPNEELLNYIKDELLAPTTLGEVGATNNGFTNFDAALDTAVAYFDFEATADRNNLMVFLSDGEPNVRGDGDQEEYCNDTATFWNCEQGVNCGDLNCTDLGLEAGESHNFCGAGDTTCATEQAYQDCVRGPNLCLNANATTQYESELYDLDRLEVERIAIGVGDESNVAEGSALWMIDNNPNKDMGVLPVQALNLKELSDALSNLCIITTDPPSASPSAAPSESPTKSPTESPSESPTDSPTGSPTATPTSVPTASPTSVPTTTPTSVPTASPTLSPTMSPTTPAPTYLLPDCYEGPHMIQKDSSSIEMCEYYPEMVQINEMSQEEVTLAINNVWVGGDVPTTMTVFVHDNGVDSVLQLKTNDGFQCLEDDGFEVDIDAEDNSFSVKCYQASEDPSGAWLAAIDVVITDDIICGTNDVPHPCYPDAGPILESCSWRIVIPCSNEAVCTDEPTSSPTKAPTDEPTSSPTKAPTDEPTSSPTKAATDEPTSSPTKAPTDEPTSSPTKAPTDEPTSSPTKAPTDEPTSSPTKAATDEPTSSPTKAATDEPTSSPIDKFGDDDETDDKYFPPVGPEPCPDDILLVKHVGITEYPHEAVEIISQDVSTVTVRVSNAFSDQSIDHLFYQYYQDYFNNKCYEDEDFGTEDFVDITIQCTVNSEIAILELWIADDIEKGFLSDGDNAVIPECCHPSFPVDTPVSKYMIEIKCETSCPEVVS